MVRRAEWDGGPETTWIRRSGRYTEQRHFSTVHLQRLLGDITVSLEVTRLVRTQAHIGGTSQPMNPSGLFSALPTTHRLLFYNFFQLSQGLRHLLL